jgi:hypothetical protein
MDKPKPPARPQFLPPINRKDSGAFTVPVEEAAGVGAVPSLRPPGEEPTRTIAVRAHTMAQAALDAVSALKGDVEGSKIGQEEFIKTTVTTAITTALPTAVQPLAQAISDTQTTLKQQNGEMISQRGTLSKITRMLTAQMTNEQNAAVRKLELLERAAHISSSHLVIETKQAELNIHWVKKYSGYIKLALAIIALVTIIAGWAGYTNLAHPHGGVDKTP